MKWLLLGVSACLGLYAQTTGRVTGRVMVPGNHEALRAEITAVSPGAAIRMNTTLTDDRGEFAIEVTPGTVLLIARAEGFASEQREIAVMPGASNAHVNVSLSPAGTVSGRVVDESGAGVAGARVWLAYRGERRSWQTADEAGGEETDAFGYFTIRVVAQGRPFVLHAESDLWLMSSSGTMTLRGLELPGVTLLLSRPGAIVSGRVVDAAGRPAPGVKIHLRAMPSDTEFSAEQRDSLAFPNTANKIATSGADGSYSFAGVPGGRITLTAIAQGARATAEAGVTRGTRTVLDLSLR